MSKENNEKPMSDTKAAITVWFWMSVVIIIIALFLGGGPGWFIGTPICVALSMLIGHSRSGSGDDDDDDDDRGPRRKSSIGKKVLIGGGAAAAGYALGKKLEL